MFVTFEGIEGAGKSTLLNLVAKALRKRGLNPLLTREPGGTALGCSLRAMLLAGETERPSPRAELCLFMADRAQHLEELIRPALAAGRIVLCDRYADSTFAYQGHGRGLDPELLAAANFMASGGLTPDLTFLLDLPVPIGLARARTRNQSQALQEARFDSESENFHQRVRPGYLRLAAREPGRFCVLDATDNPAALARICLERLGPLIAAADRT